MEGPDLDPLEEPHRDATDASSTGLDPTLAASLAYLLGPITGILFLLVERKSLFVRFHAMQSTITFVGLFVISVASGFVPLIGPVVGFLASVAAFVLWILLMVKAFQGETFMLPVVGEMAEERTRLP